MKKILIKNVIFFGVSGVFLHLDNKLSRLMFLSVIKI